MEEFVLKPCPFCGGKAEYILNGVYNYGSSQGWEFGITCTGCRVSLPTKHFVVGVSMNNTGEIVIEKDERDKAARMWNRRPSPEALEVTE